MASQTIAGGAAVAAGCSDLRCPSRTKLCRRSRQSHLYLSVLSDCFRILNGVPHSQYALHSLSRAEGRGSQKRSSQEVLTSRIRDDLPVLQFEMIIRRPCLPTGGEWPPRADTRSRRQLKCRIRAGVSASATADGGGGGGGGGDRLYKERENSTSHGLQLEGGDYNPTSSDTRGRMVGESDAIDGGTAHDKVTSGGAETAEQEMDRREGYESSAASADLMQKSSGDDAEYDDSEGDSRQQQRAVAARMSDGRHGASTEGADDSAVPSADIPSTTSSIYSQQQQEQRQEGEEEREEEREEAEEALGVRVKKFMIDFSNNWPTRLHKALLAKRIPDRSLQSASIRMV
ncbi:hypothetical protein CBR_g38610 [Chara braunii]|uniref:Uncharacterized protein n=1 Tax=Chara braunii TaxID=69332 RepID=A0A388K0H6_CHABU|nr:hypothetical protein CBR_g38610 [Chara braunii]|eukprot:GBG63542.1 hypothetical protein CBR_g38610 [Chara braunii]